MILTREELQSDPDLAIAREMELDPSFIPCRDERCDREDLHREHLIAARRKQRRMHCPKCESAVTYVRHGEQHEVATCAACAWRGYFRVIDEKESESECAKSA